MAMILKALPQIGNKATPARLFEILSNLYKNTTNPEKRALGSIGGASNGGTIKLVNGIFVRVK